MDAGKHLWENIHMLTLHMLNCFKDYKKYIHIFNNILDLAWPKWMKLTLEQQYMFSVLLCQYHACWCSGNFMSQGISKHGIVHKAGVFRLQLRKS